MAISVSNVASQAASAVPQAAGSESAAQVVGSGASSPGSSRGD